MSSNSLAYMKASSRGIDASWHKGELSHVMFRDKELGLDQCLNSIPFMGFHPDFEITLWAWAQLLCINRGRSPTSKSSTSRINIFVNIDIVQYCYYRKKKILFLNFRLLKYNEKVTFAIKIQTRYSCNKIQKMTSRSNDHKDIIIWLFWINPTLNF